MDTIHFARQRRLKRFPRAAAARLAACALAVILGGTLAAESPGGQAGQRGRGAATPRAAAAIDLTGYWVSLITEDWSFRMITPPKGDYRYLPLNAEARRVADTWDAARDAAAGEACKGYGPVGVMRLPGRLRIAWQDDQTLRIETDAGTQTRLLRFGPGQPPSARTLQGHSVATWDLPVSGGIAGFNRPRATGPQTPAGGLTVVTTHMRPGYLRKNGVPYGERAVLTEHFVRLSEPNGDEYLAVTAILDDPQYLTRPYIRTVQFKREADGAGWSPTPCSSR